MWHNNGDGNIYKGCITLISTDKEMIDLFDTTVKKISTSHPTIQIRKKHHENRKKTYSIKFNSKILYNKLQEYKPKPYQWFFPEFLKTNKNICGFISGLFDTDGCVSLNKRSVSLHSKYKGGLLQVKRNLEFFDIRSNIYYSERINKIDDKYYFSKVYSLKIYDKHSIQNFKNHIGFRLTRKKEILNKACSSMTFEDYDISKYYDAMKLREEKGYGYRKIAKVLDLKKTTVSGWLYQNTKPTSLKRIEGRVIG